MGLMDGLRRLTQPFGDEDDYFEGADGAFIPQEQPVAEDAQTAFENTFAEEPSGAPEPASRPSRPTGGLFGGHSGGQTAPRAKQKSRKAAASSGGDQSVIRFNPADFDQAGDLVAYLEQGRSLIMSLEEVPTETARRLLDFMSGIAFALNGKITPVSAKTYFVTPENVDLLDARNTQSEPEY